MSAPGNKGWPLVAAGLAGFTLLELLLVVAIIAMSTAGVSLALRDVGQTQLEREGLRLAAMLDSARARSRASGVPVYWRADATGFAFIGLPQPAPAEGEPPAVSASEFAPAMRWLADGVTVSAGNTITLGPEPVIAPQDIVLAQGDQRIHVRTDGLRAFQVQGPPASGSGP